MSSKIISRRRFLKKTAWLAGAAALTPLSVSSWAAGPKPTAVDQVTLGKTGLKLSRLGIGTGSKGGSIHRGLGQEAFTRLIRYAYDQGITYIDTAKAYGTHTMVREAIRGLPREKLFILSKMPGNPENPQKQLDQFRKELGTDYIDTLLVHCTVTPNWDDERRRILDTLEEAKDKQIIRAHGVSCHSLPALKRSVDIDFVDVHLVRLNPQGVWMDTPALEWNATSNITHVAPVVEQVQRMRQMRRGVIGMKLIGNGQFTDPADREKAIRLNMQHNLTDAVTIGLKSPAEVDEAVKCINRVLAETV